MSSRSTFSQRSDVAFDRGFVSDIFEELADALVLGIGDDCPFWCPVFFNNLSYHLYTSLRGGMRGQAVVARRLVLGRGQGRSYGCLGWGW